MAHAVNEWGSESNLVRHTDATMHTQKRSSDAMRQSDTPPDTELDPHPTTRASEPTSCAPEAGSYGRYGGLMNMELRLTAIETLMPTLATRADVAEMRADLHKADSSIKAWMIATIIGLFFGFAGLFFAMSGTMKMSPLMAAATHPPIIIHAPAGSTASTPGTSPSDVP